MNDKISIVVPIYKVEQYLRQCVDSLLSQTYKNFELILVDDGSPDNCGSICDEYAKNDDRIIVIHKANGGLVSACKSGIQKSTGKYLAFVDSDDWVENDYLEIMYDEAVETGADIIYVYSFNNFMDSQTKQPVRLAPGFYDRKELENNLFESLISNKIHGKLKSISESRCGKLYNNELVKSNLDTYDENTTMGEDFLFNIPIIIEANGICVPKKKQHLYHYRVLNNSMSHTYITKIFDRYKRIYLLLKQATKLKNRYDFTGQLDRYLYYAALSSLLHERRRINSCPASVVISEIANICNDVELQSIKKRISISSFDFKHKILAILLNAKLAILIYLVLKLVPQKDY